MFCTLPATRAPVLIAVLALAACGGGGGGGASAVAPPGPVEAASPVVLQASQPGARCSQLSSRSVPGRTSSDSSGCSAKR